MCFSLALQFFRETCFFSLLLSLLLGKAKFHHLQRSLDAGMESYIVQLDYSVAFDRAGHSGLLFKYKSIGVGGSVLSILCRVTL